MNLVITALIVLGILSRLIIHIPNFTPVIAIALFGGVYLEKRLAVIVPLVLMALSDILIGFHDTMLFTWGSIVIISGLGLVLRNRKTTANIFLFGLISSILFFLVTNLGVWLSGSLYPRTLQGLYDCFILAIPFFKYEFLATVIYTTVLFGSYEIIAKRIKKTKLANAL